MDNQSSSGMKSNSALKFITPAIAVLIIAGAAIWMNNKPNDSMSADKTPTGDNMKEQDTVTPTEETNPNNSGAMMDKKQYKAGSYAATGNYQSPAGNEEVGITLSIDASGNITDAKAEIMATNPASKKWQGTFASGFGAEVIGKSIDQVSLGVVNGSSLTPKGFSDALEKIKAQAVVNS